MDRINIDTWANISQEGWTALLLGNGASIAIHRDFAYPSLHSVADAKGLVTTTAPIFAKLGTTDFEHVLLACWYVCCAEIVVLPISTFESHDRIAGACEPFDELDDFLLLPCHVAQGSDDGLRMISMREQHGSSQSQIDAQLALVGVFRIDNVLDVKGG
jgi:hypothetical protein